MRNGFSATDDGWPQACRSAKGTAAAVAARPPINFRRLMASEIGVTYLPAGFHNVLPGPNAYRDEGATSLSEIEDVVRVSISGDARNPRNLDVPCDDVQLIGDHRTGEAVARYAHSRKTLSGPQRRSSPDGGQAGAAAEFGAGESEASRITHDNGVASGASVSAGLPFSVKSMVMTSSRTSCG